jgi:uncharacterized protein (DUF1697 family)
MRYIAFLRAINVGGHVVKMDRLRALFEGLGFTNVETFIASGNVIFDTRAKDPAKMERQIEKSLQEALGYPVTTFVRSVDELSGIASREPNEGCTLWIGFLKSAPAKPLVLKEKNDEVRVYDREVYWLCRTKMSESTFSGALLEKTLGMPATLRNVTTVRKLAEKYGTG